jgi:choloylglycine hydrolase
MKQNKKMLITILLVFILLVGTYVNSVHACTSFVIKTQDGSPIYGRTMEWGVFDLQSDLVLVPRNLPFTSELGGGKQGMTWKNKYGYVAINGSQNKSIRSGWNERNRPDIGRPVLSRIR